MRGVPLDVFLMDRLKLPLREIQQLPNRVVMEVLAMVRLENELKARG